MDRCPVSFLLPAVALAIIAIMNFASARPQFMDATDIDAAVGVTYLPPTVNSHNIKAYVCQLHDDVRLLKKHSLAKSERVKAVESYNLVAVQMSAGDLTNNGLPLQVN